MARKRIAEPFLKGWREVDKTLQQIAQLQRELDLTDAALNESIEQLRAKYRQESEATEVRIKELVSQVKEYCDANPDEFKQRKTRVLTHGSVGYRESTIVQISDPQLTMELCEELGWYECIRVKREPDKEAIKKLNSRELLQIQAAIKTRNTFGYELAETTVADTVR